MRAAAALLIALACCAWGVLPVVAAAEGPGTVELEVLDATGQPEIRAGVHPDRFVERVQVDPSRKEEDARELVIDLPKGFGGNLNAVPLCPGTVFGEIPHGAEQCPAESQIGVMYLAGGESESESEVRLYSVEPAPNELAVVGGALFMPFRFVIELRPGGQGLSMRARDFPAPPAEIGRESKLELWGVPADHQSETSIPRKPLLTTPTRCDAGPISIVLGIRTWERPDLLQTMSGDTGQPVVGCEELPFAPAIEVEIANPVADARTGARIELTVPRDDNPEGRVNSQVRSASFALPEGMTVSPGGAEGLALCGDDQFGLDLADEPACPAASRAGSVELAAPQFDEPLRGSMYLGQERPGERFRLFVALSGRGAQMKLAGSLRPDPATGRLTAVLNDMPEAAFDRMTLSFDAGRGALLVTPAGCGPARTVATLTPYSGTAPATVTSTVAIAAPGGAPCAGPPRFAPALYAAGSSTRAGRPTSFRTLLRRADGEALPDRLELSFPAGMSASLGEVARCAGPALAQGECPAASRIGRALAELGPGGESARLSGDTYLTGPYRGGPFGLALVFDAKVGPFRLGTLVVRAALRLDPRSGRLTVLTDSLPRVFEGVSVRFREIGLDVDRPGFLRNPTGCAPASIDATVSAVGAASARLAIPFALRGCIDMPFRPAFAIELSGRDELHRGGKPAVRIVTRTRARDANLAALDVALPKLLKLDPSGLRELCARGEALTGDCSRGSRVGSAVARTPLLDEPLRGSVHVAQPRGKGAPGIWVHLQGSGVSLDVESSTESRDGRFHTILGDLPDMPLRKLVLSFDGGRPGVFSLAGGLCRHGSARALHGRVRGQGQNGARASARVPVRLRPECK